MWAIRNKRTKKWLYGTDFRHVPHTQRTSHEQVLTFEYLEEAEYQFKRRQCGKDYKIVAVRIEEVKNG